MKNYLFIKNVIFLCLFVPINPLTLAQVDITNYRGAVSAQYYDSPVGETIDKVVDNVLTSKFLTNHNTCWIQYLATGLYIVNKYTISSASDFQERDPKSWALRGSLDGNTWKTLDIQSNQKFASRSTKYTYNFTNTTPYQYYRIDLNNGSSTVNALQVAELEFLGTLISDTSTIVPVAPSNLTAASVSSSQINLSWSDNSNNETYFRVERSSTGISGWLYLPASGPNSKSYSNIGLDSVTNYYFRVCAINTSGISEYSNITSAKTYSSLQAPMVWAETWHAHDQVMTKIAENEDVATYYDPDVNKSVTWLHQFMTDVWRYAKTVYARPEKDTRLYAMFHQNKFGGGCIQCYFDSDANYKNITDCGTSSWEGKSGWNIDAPAHEVGHIVEGSSNGYHNSPAFSIWKDSKWCEIFVYDVYKALGMTSEATRLYNTYTANTDNYPVAGTYWFRDWFYPIYSKYGEAKTLAKFFTLLVKHFNKTGPTELRNDMNYGEFVHFWSGAAGVNLKDQAAKAFGWTSATDTQFKQAQKDFPNVVYSTNSVENDPFVKVNSFTLLQNFPNPFNPTTRITYSVATAGKVTLKVFDMLGKEVKTLISEVQLAGTYSYVFEADGLSSGVYIYKIQTGSGFSEFKKMVLVR